jgi:pimeloyl-ACP methyl ester carboxylesterase
MGCTLDATAEKIERFGAIVGFDRYANYVFDYGAPIGFRLAMKHPERITAIISQNGNAYAEGLSEGWNPIRAYWENTSLANRQALRVFLERETTVWQFAHGVPDPIAVSPDGYSLDNYYLARPFAVSTAIRTARSCSAGMRQQALPVPPQTTMPVLPHAICCSSMSLSRNGVRTATSEAPTRAKISFVIFVLCWQDTIRRGVRSARVRRRQYGSRCG